MNGGVDEIDTSYEKLRTEIQKRLSTVRSNEEYNRLCKELLQEIVSRSDGDKFLEISGEVKTLFYDFTPALIRETRENIAAKSLEDRGSLTFQEIGQGTKKDFISAPKDAIKVSESLEKGVRIQEETKEK